jgi:hypothetical protein
MRRDLAHANLAASVYAQTDYSQRTIALVFTDRFRQRRVRIPLNKATRSEIKSHFPTQPIR